MASRFPSLLFAALGAILLPVLARSQTSYSLRDDGRARALVLAADEMHVVQRATAAADLQRKLEASAPGTTVREASKGRALIQVANAAQSPTARATALSRAVPGAQAEAVLYPPGAPRNAFTRRIATAEVLVRIPPGQTAASLASSVGATDTRATAVAGHVLMRFASGFHALEATARLEALDARPEIQMRRLAEKHAAPNDVFFPNQWHLRNSGQGGGVVGIDANVVPAWDFTRGAGATIAIIDDSLETTHPDLAPNCPSIASGFHYDFNSDDPDPAPDEIDDEHGTAVGGVAAARGDNAIGVSGAAPLARLIGMRLISLPSTDAEEAAALYWHPTGLSVDVANNSWGYPTHYSGARTLGKQALRDAATLGRGGLGQITLFSAGNSQEASRGSRDANTNSYANSRYVIAVGSISNFGAQSLYSQRGANLLVSAPSSDSSNPLPRLSIWTTDDTGNRGYNPGAGEPSPTIDPQQAYTNSFGGTSSASPLAAGCVALLLSAAPGLGWRDVHEIVAATARLVQPTDPGWVVNGGGFKFNNRYGGGMIDATAAAVRGVSWENLGPEQVQSRAATALPAAIPDNNTTGVTRTFDFTSGPNLRVERVEVLVRMTHAHRSDVEIALISPAGTRSLLSELRPTPFTGNFYDDDIDIDENGGAWTFTTTHSWGENSSGIWSLRARDLRTGTTGSITIATVRLYGTAAPLERVGFEAPAYTVNEAGTSQTVRVQRVGAATGAFSIDVATATQGTATASQDFTGVTQTLDFAADEPFKDLTIDILQDTATEPLETIFLVLKNPVGVALGGVSLARVTIRDDEARPVTAVASDATAGETPVGVTPDAGTIVIARVNADAAPLTVNLAIGGTAANGGDYLAAEGANAPAPMPTTVVIPAFATSVSYRIIPKFDETFEGSESVTVTVLPDGLGEYDVGTPDTALVDLLDDERPALNVLAAVSSVAETATTPVNFRIVRDVADPLQSLIVKLSVEGTAVPGDNYIDLPEQVEIPPGQIGVDVPLQPVDDALYIPLKSVLVRLRPSPDYREDFSTSATIQILEDDPLPDTGRPTVAIKAPANKSRFSKPAAVEASGTAKDNVGVVRVHFSVNDGLRRLATGTAAWTADLTADLLPGPNRLSVQSEDADGNLSVPAVVVFSYVQPRTLTVGLTGNGTVTKGFAPSSSREAGQTYTIVATPNAGSVFAGWSGDLSGLARSFTFIMPDADSQLTAAFITDPFLPPLQGLYTGAVRAPEFAWEKAGLLQLAVTAKGACSGSLFFAGAKLALKGEFNGVGRLRTTILRAKSTPLLLDLTLDIAGSARQIAGTVASPDFTCTVVAERAGFGKGAPYPLVAPFLKGETYTFFLPAETTPPLANPHGTGYGICTIDASGNVKWSATLADNVIVSGGVPLTADLRCVLYASLYAGKGLLLGEAAVDQSAVASDFAGTFDWFKPANPKDKAFLAGFSRLGATVAGSLYSPPPKPATETVFKTAPTTTGTLDLIDGNVFPVLGLHEIFTLGLDHKLTVNALDPRNPPHGLVITLDTAKGYFNGSFIDAKFPTKTLRKFRGVILQKTHTGRGGFLGDTLSHTGLQTGSVTLTP